MQRKGFRKITAILTAVCMVISMWAITGPPVTVYATGGTWSGAGTEASPYLIEDAADLIALSDPANSDYWDDCFEQTQDINLSGVLNWTPIGDDWGNAFTGAYDGGGFTISNLTIDDDTLDAVGLFGFAGTNGVLKNVILEDVNVASSLEDAYAYVGGLVGNHTDWNGIIERCSVSGSVSGASTAEVGGLAGSSNAIIRFSSSSGIVRGTDNVYCVGGIVGFNYGTVKYSYSTADVTVGNNTTDATNPTYAGGLIGTGDGADNCYSSGSVTAGDNTGNENMFVGGLYGGGSGDIENCYSVGSVSGGSGAVVAGLATDEDGIPEVTDSYFDSETSGTTAGVGTPKTTAEMQDPDTYLNWNPVIWLIEAGAYPVLTGQRPQIFAGGEGTFNDPYQVATAAHLDDVRDYPDDYFIQTADITLPDPAPGGSNWTSIGDSSDPFEGTYDGDGHTISGLTISSSAISYAGLFGYLSEGSLINIGMENVRINVSAPGSYADAGGLVGCIGSGDVENSYSTGEVNGSGNYARVGGLVGFNEGGSVNDSYSTANVSGSGTNAFIGGLIGYNENYSEYCYSTGQVTGSGINVGVGGLTGGGNPGNVDYCYYLDTAAPSSAGGTALTAAEMKQQVSFESWDFGGTWLIAETQSYPVLSWQVSFAGGDGSEDEPYEIETVLQLNKVRGYIDDDSVHFLQTGNITLPTVAAGESNWTPIEGEPHYSFSGAYDGGGFTISNLTINDGTLNYAGLFQCISESATIRDITLENVSIRLEGDSWLHAGALAGKNEGSISGSRSRGSITCIRNADSAAVNIGGLVGSNDGTVDDSYSSCDIDVISENIISIFAGGLIGFNMGNITGSYSSGDVTVEAENADPSVSVGGLVGSHDEGSIADSYSTGNVSAGAVIIVDTDVHIGGLVGYQYANISNTYSVGTVTGGESAETGGLIGYHHAGTVTGSYYDSDVSGLTTSSAGITPLSTAQMKQRATFNPNPGEGWDFDTVWRITENQSYPVLQWQPLPPAPPTGGGGGGGGTPPPAPVGTITAQPTLNQTTGIAGASINNATLNAALEKAVQDSAGKKTIEITVPPVQGATGYQTSLPAGVLTGAGSNTQIAIKTDVADVTLPGNMIPQGTAGGASNVSLTVAQADLSGLDEETRNQIGDRPVIQLTLSVDGQQTDWSNPDAPVTVSIPYTPTVEELDNPEGIVVWYIDGSGNTVSVPNGRYDPVTGTVTVDVTHFSDYAVVYNPVSFSDVAAGAWYGKAVSFIAARDITTGTGGGNFSPGAKLTRGQFLVMLMKAYEIAPDTSITDNFSDAGSTYYTGYLAAAKRLGISEGVGNNLFAPGRQITREEMFTLLYNALKGIGSLPQTSESDGRKTLSDFSDADQIAFWAKDAMALLTEAGTISGSGGKLNPVGTTTRAEMAQVLYNLMAK